MKNAPHPQIRLRRRAMPRHALIRSLTFELPPEVCADEEFAEHDEEQEQDRLQERQQQLREIIEGDHFPGVDAFSDPDEAVDTHQKWLEFHHPQIVNEWDAPLP